MTKNLLTDGADGFWFSYLVYAHPDVCPPEDTHPWARTLSNSAFLAGARWATRQTSELSPYVSRFIEMMILLGYLDDDAPLTRANEVALESRPPISIYRDHLEDFADVPF